MAKKQKTKKATKKVKSTKPKVTKVKTKSIANIESKKKRPKIIAVILAYNVAPMLPRALERIPKDLVDDIIVMDDGSKDGTHEVAKKLGLKVFRHTPNVGYGGNISEGLERAFAMGADYAVEIHGDGAQFNPESIRYALKYMEEGKAQLILGSRFQQPGKALENGMPLIRFVANRFLSFFDRIVLNLPLTEFHTGFRIYGKNLLKNVPYKENAKDYVFSFEIIAQAAFYNMPVREVPVEADYNSEHTSHAVSGAAVYAITTFGILAQFVLARLGIYRSKIFKKMPNK